MQRHSIQRLWSNMSAANSCRHPRTGLVRSSRTIRFRGNQATAGNRRTPTTVREARFHHHQRTYTLGESLEHFNPYAQAVGRILFGMTAVCVLATFVSVRCPSAPIRFHVVLLIDLIEFVLHCPLISPLCSTSIAN
jgi:hypothetical protein